MPRKPATFGLLAENLFLHLQDFLFHSYISQVLSHSVGSVMAAYGGEECQETATFILLADRFFDCLNGRSLVEGDYKRKPDLMPYRSQTDPRFQVSS